MPTYKGKNKQQSLKTGRSSQKEPPNRKKTVVSQNEPTNRKKTVVSQDEPTNHKKTVIELKEHKKTDIDLKEQKNHKKMVIDLKESTNRKKDEIQDELKNRKKYEISQKEPTIDQENIPNTYGGQLVADEDSQPLETVHEEKDNTLEINSVLGDEPFDIDDLQDDALLFPEEVTDKTTTYNPVIKNITLHNFKSYHGIHSIDMTNFTTIVGPNGSGKSNLLDAILFIFGYQAKKMRQTKIQELIHKDCHTCSVEITFLLSEHDQEENLNHNEEKYDHKSEDKSQEKKDDCSMEKDKSKSQKFIRLKREISGNKSTYYFDREKISTEQLKMNLLKYNIPLENNRFMILQGEIEAIAQMKPKDEQNGGILEYLEEIIGTNRYIPKIRQIEEKMVDVKEKYEYTKNIYKLKERENQNNVKILEGIKINVKNKYEEIKIEESLYDLKKNLQREKNKKIGEENKELEKELKTMQKSEQVSELKKLEKELKEKKNLNHKLEREYLVKKSHYTKIKRENEHKKKEREQKEKEIEELKKEIKKCEEKILIDKKEVEEIDSKIMTYDNDLKELESRIKNKTEELSILLNNSKNQDKRNKLNTMIKTLENELLIKRRETHNTIHLNQLNDIVEKLRYIHNLVEPKKKFNEEPVNKSNEEPVNKLNEEQDIIQSIKKLKTDLHSINQTIYKKEEKIRTIQTDDGPSTIHHFRNIQFNDDCSNKESRKNTVHGKLSDLISTSKKYDTAITSALKSHLNSIIVSDERTAKECIRIVKEKKLQRTTFLIMDQIKAYTFKKDPNMIYAIDLIECNNEYSDIVSFLIKDTVLFEDFNTSLKETKNKKLRAVTLKGELIEKSGLITRTPVNGALSKRNNHSNEETLRNELERINSAKCNLIKKIEELENVVERLPELKRYQNIMRVKEYFNKTLRERVSEIIQRSGNDTNSDNNLNVGTLNVGTNTTMSSNNLNIETNTTMGGNNSNIKTNTMGGVKGIDLIVEQLIEKKVELKDLLFEFDSLNKTIKEIECKIEKCKSDIVSMTTNEEKVLQSDIDCLNEQVGVLNISIYNEKENRMRVTNSIKNNKCYEYKNRLERYSNNLGYSQSKEDEVKISENENNFEDHLHKETLKLQNTLEESNREIETIMNTLKDKQVLIDQFIQKELDIRKNIEENNRVLSNVLKKKNYESDKRELIQLGYVFDQNNGDNSDDGSKKSENNTKKNNSDDNNSENNTKKKKLDNNSDEENKSDDYSDSNYSDENNSKKNKTVHDNTKKKKLDNNSDENKILELEKQLKNIQIITVDYNQLKEKKIKCDEFMKYSQFYENISNIFKKYSNSLHQIKSLRHNQFMKGLKTINKYLKVFYQKITFGGNAELELVDISDPFEGINLSIMPPKKTWCKIGSLSGGEKTLSSLSLVFSLHKYRPSSFYIMDEIDAALDYKNVSIIAQLLKEIKSQFIIISLRNNMFEITHRMIGVYKVGNGSRVISVDGGLF